MPRHGRVRRLPLGLAGLVALVGCVNASQPAPATLGSAQPSVHDPGPHAHPTMVLPATPIGAPTEAPRVIPTAPFRVQGAMPPEKYTPMAAPAEPSVAAKILVIAADGKEVELPAIKQALDYMGTPYDVWVSSERPGQLTADKLATGDDGHYQGVILTMGVPVYYDGANWKAALAPAEWEALWAYEAAFKVRQVTWYTWPSADLGFGSASAVDTSTTALEGRLTSAGAAVFKHMNAQQSLPIRHAYTYLAPPLDDTTTPLLTDGAGNALVAVKAFPDGRENLAMTFDSNPHLTHAQVLSYGVISWLTRGVFLGERRSYMSAQVDDVFYPNDLWGGGSHRMDARDLRATVEWQRSRRLDPVTPDLKLDLVFNGEGATGSIAPDDFTPAAKQLQGEFKWISHTYTHLNLDAVTEATARSEVENNHGIASQLRFSSYSRDALVTGQVSGLKNPAAMKGAYAGGVRFVVSDTSRPGEDNPTPNAGIYNWHQPGILMIPRRPTNLFYNVSTPEEWVGEYNHMYRAFWGHDVTYAELLDKESDVLLGYLLKGEMNPWMFHQSNLRAYDGRRTLLGDLIDTTVAKYKRYFSVPITSPTMTELGKAMAARMVYNTAGVRAEIVPGATITLTAQSPTTVAVTGVPGGNAEMVGSVPVRRVPLAAGQSVTLSLTDGTVTKPKKGKKK